MTPPARSPLLLDKLLSYLPPHIAASLDSQQLDALQQAFHQALQQQTRSRRHPVNLRLSVPFIGSRFYLVVLAGPERRSRERLASDRQLYPIWTPGNLLVILGATAAGAIALLALLGLSQLERTWVPPRVAPAAIPFKADADACEHSGRSWEDGECIDFEHDPTF